MQVQRIQNNNYNTNFGSKIKFEYQSIGGGYHPTSLNEVFFVLKDGKSEVDTTLLKAYKGMEETGTGVDRRYTYSDKLYIGEYDKKSEFRVSDIETRIKDKRKSYLGFFAVALTGLATLILCATLRGEQKMQEATKPLIENVDSVANKAKSVLPDTTAVKTKVLKTIKK